MTRLLPAIGSGYHPTAWCANCGDPYPVESVCPCVLEDEAKASITHFIHDLLNAANIRRRTLALLAERYGPKCTDCGQPAAFNICASCLGKRV
ncbi:hypothetical protein [Deinococcus rubellus]|uniref:Uncharacterized protein n=1 Tax=Deinococcus rubellus TaxID=1889240 RepID=A0ABY5YI38_9DEIO|nr:hypothetical protein [Deinococcus rubellus]UWX64784.1 hypothetical protein N0D28_03735 [Deinococcus rubellus]